MLEKLRSFINPYVLLFLICLLLSASVASYGKGRADGKSIEKGRCDEGKNAAAADNVAVKKKQDKIRAHYPDNAMLLERLRDGTYP